TLVRTELAGDERRATQPENVGDPAVLGSTVFSCRGPDPSSTLVHRCAAQAAVGDLPGSAVAATTTAAPGGPGASNCESSETYERHYERTAPYTGQDPEKSPDD